MERSAWKIRNVIREASFFVICLAFSEINDFLISKFLNFKEKNDSRLYPIWHFDCLRLGMPLN